MRVRSFSLIGLKLWAVATDEEKVADKKKAKFVILVPPSHTYLSMDMDRTYINLQRA